VHRIFERCWIQLESPDCFCAACRPTEPNAPDHLTPTVRPNALYRKVYYRLSSFISIFRAYI
jgi:hypothetical protein